MTGQGKRWVKLELDLQKGVHAVITIMDNVCIMTCDKKGLMQQNFEAEKRAGNARAGYDKVKDVYIERYDGWRLERIAEKITKECKGQIVGRTDS